MLELKDIILDGIKSGVLEIGEENPYIEGDGTVWVDIFLNGELINNGDSFLGTYMPVKNVTHDIIAERIVRAIKGMEDKDEAQDFIFSLKNHLADKHGLIVEDYIKSNADEILTDSDKIKTMNDIIEKQSHSIDYVKGYFLVKKSFITNADWTERGIEHIDGYKSEGNLLELVIKDIKWQFDIEDRAETIRRCREDGICPCEPVTIDSNRVDILAAFCRKLPNTIVVKFNVNDKVLSGISNGSISYDTLKIYLSEFILNGYNWTYRDYDAKLDKKYRLHEKERE